MNRSDVGTVAVHQLAQCVACDTMRSTLMMRKNLELAGAMTLGSGVVVRPGRPLLLMVRAGPDFIVFPLSPTAARELARTLTAEADTAESDGPRRRR